MDINLVGTTEAIQEAGVDLSLNCLGLSKAHNLFQDGIKLGGQY